jgi:hypothetical protein
MRASNCTCVPTSGSTATEPSAQSTLQKLESVQDTLQTIHILAGILKYVWRRSPAMAMGLDVEERRNMEDIKAALLRLMCDSLSPPSSFTSLVHILSAADTE